MNPLSSLNIPAAMTDNLTPADRPAQAEGRSYDDNAKATAIRHADGSMEYRVEGSVRGNYADAVKSASDPWEYAMHPRTKSRQTAHEVTGDSIIKLPGKPEVTADQAVMMGWLERPKASGAQAAAPEAAQQAEPKTEEVHPDLQVEAVDQQTEQTLTTIAEGTSPMSQIEAVQEIAATGDISERRLGELASQMQMEPAQFQTLVDTMRPVFEAQANRTAESLGVDPEDVWAWASEAKPREWQEAVNRHLTMRNTHGYQKLAQHFVQNLDTINPDAILSAEVIGGKVERIGGKIVLTDAKGRRMTWSEALALGIKPERKR